MDDYSISWILVFSAYLAVNSLYLSRISDERISKIFYTMVAYFVRFLKHPWDTTSRPIQKIDLPSEILVTF